MRSADRLASGFATDAIGLRHQARSASAARRHAGLEPTLPSREHLDFLRSASAAACSTLAADAVGLGEDAAVGLGGRVREPGREPSLPFLAQGVDFLTMALGGLVRGPRQGVDLEPGLVCGLARLVYRVLRLLRFESGPLGLGGHPALGVGGSIGEPRLQAAIPLVAHGIDFRRPHLGGVARRRRRRRPGRPAGVPAIPGGPRRAWRPLRFGLAARVFALLGEPIGHLGGLGLEIGLQTAHRVRRSPYEDRDRASQALSGRSAGKSSKLVSRPCKPNRHNSLTNRGGKRRIEGLVSRRGRLRFDGDMVSQDACRGPSTSQIRWKKT